MPCRRGFLAGAVHHVSSHYQHLPLSGNMGDKYAHAGPLRSRVSDVTRRFMLIRSFLEPQRTARFAFTSIPPFFHSLLQSLVTAAHPVVGAGTGRAQGVQRGTSLTPLIVAL